MACRFSAEGFRKNTRLLLVLLFSTASMSLTARASEPADIEAGKLAFATCTVCHGANAEGNTSLGGPALAGQHEAYLNRQMQHFSNGVRGSDKDDSYGQQMAAMAMTIKDANTQTNISAYLASLEKPSILINDDKTAGGTLNGYKYYQASCGACHSGDLSGNAQLNSPSLAGLSSDYLKRQYMNFLSGKRGVHKEDKYGRQMKMIAATLADEKNIDDVIAYIVSLNQ